LGRIISFSEGGSVPALFYERTLGLTKADGGGEISAPVPVEGGEQEIRADVTIVYEMK
jgi:uncharacterized protein YggE